METKKIGLLLGLGLLLFLAGCTQNNVPSGKYDTFAQCLTDEGAIMYGAFWCQHCAKVKASFGDSFKKVNYVECDPKGEKAQPQVCIDKEIEAYATFIFKDGSRLVGEPTLQQLSEKTGCVLPEDN